MPRLHGVTRTPSRFKDRNHPSREELPANLFHRRRTRSPEAGQFLRRRRAGAAGTREGTAIRHGVALMYAREGADVAIVYLPEEESDAKEIKGEIDSLGRRVLLLPGDLRDPDFCAETVRRTVEELGGLNILVSNAAYLNSQTELEHLTSEDFDRVFKTNVYAYFHLVMAAVPHMSQGDSIIATASEEALKGSDLMMDYAASKAAVVVFTKSIAPHLVKKGIRANVVAPGPTWSALNLAGQRFTDDYLTNLGTQTPLGRVAQPEELAPAYVYLASDADSSYTIGETIAATGGYTDSR